MAKLLNSNYKINLIETEEIKIDKNLPKYKHIRGINVDIDSSIEAETLIGIPESESSNIITFGETLTNYIGLKNCRDFNLHISFKLIRRLHRRSNNVLNLQNNNNVLLSEYLNQDKSTSNKTINNENFISKFFSKLKKRKKKVVKIDENQIFTLDISDVFKSVKVLINKGEEFEERVISYLTLIRKAQAMGQVAQEEELVDNLILHIYESSLVSTGFNKYITCDELRQLQLKCKIQLNLDYIKNFARIIPDEVAQSKLEADQLHIFDNYVVLHYDPDGKGFKLTKEEVERKKDPILFGLIQGSDRLYYIGDWIDEYCDLTLEKVVKELNKATKLLE